MHVVAARLTFHLPASNSLKAKRRASQALVSRLRQRFNVSVAEVDGNDRWQTLVLGLAFVSNQAQHAAQMLEAALGYAQSLRLDAQLVEVERDLAGGW